MFKRIVVGILSVVLAGGMLTGCTFFSHNYERDYQQVVAVVKPYEIQNEVKTADGTEKKTYTTTEHKIYKRDVVDYMSNNQSDLTQQYSSMEDIVKHVVKLLVNTEIIASEVDAKIDAGLIEWGQKEINSVNMTVYTVIDKTLVSLKNDILDGRDEPKIDTDLEAASATPTYTIKPDETFDEASGVTPEVWKPSASQYPGLFGDGDERSLDRQALRAFIALLKSKVKNDFRVTAEDKELFKKDDEEIQKVTDERGLSYVYEMLGDTHYVDYVSKKNVTRSVKLSAFQNYLSTSVTVGEAEVLANYNKTLNAQKDAFNSNVALFDTAMSGSDTVLYYPNSNYFYVKHILLPFSDEQKADYETYKKTATDDDAKAYRDMMAENIVCYPHINGEDDKTRPMTVDEVMNVVKAKMKQYENDIARADVAFDDLIYDYNTDPGAFNNNKGYVVKDADSGNNYMEEFTDGARKLKKEYKPGQILPEKVITDYGVHIMYYASNCEAGERALNAYTTPGEVTTYYKTVSDDLLKVKRNAVYSAWEKNVLDANYNDEKKVTIYEDRYSDLWNK